LEKVLTRLPSLAFLYSRPYLGVVEREIRLAAIADRDVVVNIGCGAVPFTAIYLARLTGARVIALDRDREAAEYARKYIKASGLAEIIEVVWGDGAQASPCEGATVWVVALQAAPKKAILEHFQKCAPQGARIMFREPRPVFVNRYDQLPSSARPQSMTSHNMVTFNRTVLFTQEA
jgi:protein-L-isoaspartate O-methyltransferase